VGWGGSPGAALGVMQLRPVSLLGVPDVFDECEAAGRAVTGARVRGERGMRVCGGAGVRGVVFWGCRGGWRMAAGPAAAALLVGLSAPLLAFAARGGHGGFCLLGFVLL